MISQILHYKIERKLGQGGMGEVFLATDTRLNRQVALKFVPESLSAGSEARERLLREAQAASKLSHPNIVTVHAIERDGDRDFIVMEYVAGRTLGDAFASGDPSLDQILDIASQLAEALQKAHAAGVVHRDLKPANVIMDADGRPRILDFGLAKIEGAAKLTQTGSTVGTVAYVSPEQLQGKQVDQRSDLFSLGVLLYEMIAGRLPFAGEHEAAMTYAIVHEEPEPLARYKKGVTQGLEAVVAKCLAKDPAERYQSAADLLADLKRERRLSQASQTSVPAPSREKRSRTGLAIALVGVLALVAAVTYVLFPSLFGRSHPEAQAHTPRIAVLPFQNIGAAEDEYFADGITEEIIARLASVRGVDVIARTSVMQYKGTDKTIPEIAGELGVDYILEGTIRWQKSAAGPGRVRITPQLVKASDGTHVWANIYEDEISAVFEVQSDVSQKVVSALNVTLLEPERKRIASTQTDDIEAYNYYLKGNEYWRQISAGNDEPNLRLAAHLYSQSVGADSGYADAWARLGRSYVELYWHHQFNDSDLTRARTYIDRALALGPQSPEVRIAIGSLHYHAGDYEAALSEFNEARKLLPNDADLVMEIAYVLRRQGHPGAVDEMKRAVALDPLAANYHLQLARSALMLGQRELVLPALDQALGLTPDYADAYATKARFMVTRNGDTAAALALLADADKVVQPANSYYFTKGYIFGLTGHYEEAIRAMEVGREFAFPGFEHFYRAFYYGLLGDQERSVAVYDSALHLIEAELKKKVDLSGTYASYAMVLASRGRHEEALAAAHKAIELNHSAINMPQCRYALVYTYITMGQLESAMTELETALRGPCEDSYYNILLDPVFAPLRSHPRFQQLAAGAS